MDISTAQFLAWTLGAFVAGLAAGIGVVALWIYRAMYVHDLTEGDL
jgi:uncharacterized protein involved in exopolysaccharide biosynthesis